MEDYQWRGGGWKTGEKAQGIRSIRYKIDKEKLRNVETKNLYLRPMDMN